MRKNKLLFIFGTRPEAIKLAPVVKLFKSDQGFETRVCVTAQHREMLDQILRFFEIVPEYDMDLMKPSQSLFDITSLALKGMEDVLNDAMPDIVFIQGDTTTALAGALAGFYKKIPVAHVEAGLRSGNKYSPFPEEMNRILAGHLCDYHFAPTQKAAENLKVEGITRNVHVVGNTVIDALLLALKNLKQREPFLLKRFSFLNPDNKIILVTAHRRESFGPPFRNICEAIREIARAHREVEIVYPVHLNPNIRKPAFSLLKDIKNVHLIEPLDYPSLVWLMNKSYFIITDSGGIQEEAPSLGKPVLVLREVTERTEGVEAGTAKLIGTDKRKIIQAAATLLTDDSAYRRMASPKNPYGDGTASQKILSIIRNARA